MSRFPSPCRWVPHFQEIDAGSEEESTKKQLQQKLYSTPEEIYASRALDCPEKRDISPELKAI